MKALALLSGGLDSTLAIRVILEQGLEVVAVNFFTPFCQCNRKKSGCGYEARKVADSLGIQLKVFNVFAEYIRMLRKPKFGYGRNLNPCIDCRILMHKQAKEYMHQIGAAFIITGEVLGQRPMSQHKQALKLIERESGLEGLILRPLSAKLLPPTIAEKEGWVERQRLLQISGRSRKPQMALAQDLGIVDYPCSAGGCLLTDPGFSRRLRDLMAHSRLSLDEIELLKIGRHFRLSREAKIIVGRNKQENQRIMDLRKPDDIYFYPVEEKGPVAIGRGQFSQQQIIDACRVVARYCDGQSTVKTAIANRIWPEGEIASMLTEPMDDAAVQKLRV